MSETIVECLEKKAKLRFIELNSVMSEALREDIIKDSGHPKLKAKCLDLISKLRLESQVLNPSKTAKAAPVPENTPRVGNAKNYDDNDREALGLDDNG